MFAYIKGSLEEIGNNYIVVETCGVGYKIFVSENVLLNIGEIGNIVKVHTYYHVREDNISLFGFLSKEELKMFELLISVSGIGAKSAITILSNIAPSSFALAVISNDVSSLKKIPGVGPKSAQRIILELKDKIKTEDTIGENEVIKETIEVNENVKEAIEALQILGYNKREIEKAFDKMANTNVSVEELIKKGLTLLSNN